jgi:hypothetical protein
MSIKTSLKNLGLTDSAVNKVALKTSDSPGGLIFSNPSHPDCPVKPTLLKTSDLDTLKRWLSGDGDQEKFQLSKEVFQTLDGLKSKKHSKESLGKDAHRHINDALQAYVSGNAEIAPYKDVLKSFFKEVSLAVYAVQNVTVCANSPWIISGDGPVYVTADNVLVFQGGIIQITTSATITVTNMQKFDFPCS